MKKLLSVLLALVLTLSLAAVAMAQITSSINGQMSAGYLSHPGWTGTFADGTFSKGAFFGQYLGSMPGSPKKSRREMTSQPVSSSRLTITDWMTTGMIMTVVIQGVIRINSFRRLPTSILSTTPALPSSPLTPKAAKS